MSNGLNTVTLVGNLGADAEVRVSEGGATVLKLRLATTESYIDKKTNERKEVTEWHRCVVFGKRAEALAKILVKGDRIVVVGSLKTSGYEKDGQKHYSTEVIARDIILCGGKGKPAAGGGATTDDAFGEEVPF